MSGFVTLCSAAFATIALTSVACAQSAAVPYIGGPFGFAGTGETQYWGSAPDEDGFRKGFSVTSFSAPVAALGSGLAWSGIGSRGFGFSGLTADGATYGYSFKGIGDTPVTLFGGVSSLRANPDVFTSLVTPGFERTNTLATSINAGVEFKPTSNLSLSLSAGYVQPSATTDTDLRSQFLSNQQPSFLGGRR